MADNNEQAASARRHFSELNTDALKEMWSAEERADWAEAILREELLKRGVSADELNDVAEHRARIGATPALQKSKTPFAQAIRIVRWITFIPAAWLAGYPHRWILHLFGADTRALLTSSDNNDFVAFGVAGFLTPIFVIAVGAWVCPAKKKIIPVFILSGLCIVAGFFALYAFSGPEANNRLQRLGGLDDIVSMAVSVMIAGVYWLAPWRKKPPSDITPSIAVK